MKTAAAARSGLKNLSAPSYAATFETIYSFPVSERLGNSPFGKLALGADGNFYGTTTSGGIANEGTVFKVTPGGHLTSLYSFAGGADGSRPYAGVVIDKAGNLFGTTSSGGTFNAGTVYRLAPDGTETVLHSFGGTGDGASPFATLTADQSGNLYGVTTKGGHGGGTLFMVTPAGAEKVLHEFVRNDGTAPQGRLYLDKSGNIYGTAAGGGNDYTGTVFRLTPAGNFSVLHDFDSGPVEGAKPFGGLVPGRKGELYGTTYTGGGADRSGTVYSIKPNGTEALVYAFSHLDGNEPLCDLVVGAKAIFMERPCMVVKVINPKDWFSSSLQPERKRFYTPLRDRRELILTPASLPMFWQLLWRDRG